MCVRYLGFLLLIWFPGVLHAQSGQQRCRAPKLTNGYLVPEQGTYFHETKLTYACADGYKPAAEGWWATSTCQDGKWSHKPRCIDEKACISPHIPNAKYTENSNGWYEEGHKIRITCAKGYQHKNRDATAECQNGTWSSVPVCEKSPKACGMPPKILHAVIVNQEYQDVFAVDSEVQYKCEDGFTVEGADTILCIAGNWTSGPSCSPKTEPSAGHDDSTVGGTGGGNTSSAGRGTQPAGGGHTTSAGRGTKPAGGGSSTTSGLNDGDSRPLVTTIDDCGTYPNVPNGDVVQKGRMSLKYKCNAFYTQDGPETVVCYNDGTWSKLPVCKETFCVIYPEQFAGRHFRLSGSEYMSEGEWKHVPCIWTDYSSLFHCTNRKISVTTCCRYYEHNRGQCRKIQHLFG